MINAFIKKSTHTVSLRPSPCSLSSFTCLWETQALAMNRWTAHTVMLSSLISEKTVKEGAAFSHTLSSFHSVVRLSMSICRSLGRTRQSRKWHSPSRSLPLLLSSHLLSPVFISYFSCLPFTPCNYADTHLSTSTSPFPFLLFQHQHSSTPPPPFILCSTKTI